MCSISAISSAREGRAARKSKKAASLMQPYLTTSAMPSMKTGSGRVSSTSGSMSTSLGCQKAPARFFPCSRSTATLPPTEESTWASRVVGICTKSTPRRMVAAANPARSPTTPPPRAATASVRVSPASIMASHSSARRAGHLEPSPAGTVWAVTRNPAPSRLARTRSRYRGATWLSVTTKIREAPGRTARSSSPARVSSPHPICMLYSRPGRATVSVFMVRPPLFKIDGIRRAAVGTRPYVTAPQVAPTQGPTPQGGLSCPCGAIHLLPSSAHANYPPPSP